MWLDTGELVRLVEKLDEAEALLAAYFADDTGEEESLRKAAAVLAEMRKMAYRDIASADEPLFGDTGGLIELKAPRKGGGGHA